MNSGGGDVDIETASPLYVNAPVTAIGLGVINLAANGVDGDIIVSDLISSENGDITLDAGQDITTSDYIVVQSINGDISLNADRDIVLGDGSYGDIYTSGAGDINLDAGGNILVDYFTWVMANGTGNIDFNADGDISLITRVPGQPSWIRTNSGYIDLTAGNDVNLGDLTYVGSDTGAITILAGNSISQGNDALIEAISGADISLEADVDDDGNGGVTQNGTASILSNGGDITVTAGTGPLSGGEDILLGLLDARDSTGDDGGGVYVATGLGSILDNNGDALNLIARDYSYLRAPNGIIGTDTDPIDVCIQVSPANLLTPPTVNGAPAISGLILEIGGVDAVTGTSGNIKGIVRPGSGYNGVNGSPMIDFANVSPPGNVYYEDTDMGGTCTVLPNYLPGYPASNFGYRELIWPWPAAASLNLGNLLALLGDQLKFRIPKKDVVDSFQISQMQGPSSLIAAQNVYFYHPLVEMSMYEMPALGIEAYEFIDNNIRMINPLLLPAVLTEEEK